MAGDSAVADGSHNRVVVVSRKVARAGVFLGTAGVAALCAFVPVDGPLSNALTLLIFAVGFEVGRRTLRPRRWVIVVGAVGGVVAAALAPYATQASVLAARGHQITATVTGTSGVDTRSPSRLYRLTDADGRPVPRRLYDASGSLAVGDRTQVVVDPDGWVAPASADEVDVAWALWVPVAAGLLPIVLASLLRRDTTVPVSRFRI